MHSLQELISRGRFAFSAAPARSEVFALVDSRRSTKDIAVKLKRHVNNIRRDLTLLSDVGLIAHRVGDDGKLMFKDGCPVFEKVPLARAIPMRYFLGPAPTPNGSSPGHRAPARVSHGRRARAPMALAVPSEAEILEIAKNGEDQIYEFKRQGVDASKITREIAAMLNTERGGLIFYGIDDDGTILGTDASRQKLDQPLQNSLRNSVSPSATIGLRSTMVLGTELIVIVVPPWNRRDVYQLDGRILIRKGTNVFAARPEEVKMLHEGKVVV